MTSLEVGDFRVVLDDRWERRQDANLHPLSLGFARRDAPFELLLRAERIPSVHGTRKHIVETYVQGSILAARRHAATMAGGDVNDEDVVGPMRLAANGPVVDGRQWVHLGDGSMVVAVLAAEVVPDAYSCLVITTICNQAVDLDLEAESLTADIVDRVERLARTGA